MSQYLFLLLILAACPLMMIFMMRGMHGGQGGNADGGHTHSMADGGMRGQADVKSSLDDLRRQRENLDREIEEREAEEQTPIGSGWR
jgi:hypothetical protein